MATTVFCAFEGGGAKGVGHLSTLRGLEALAEPYGLTVRGYAGTSAGAIVAALAASGWSARDMLDHAAVPVRSAALEAVGRGDASSLLDLFDPPARARLRLLIGVARLLGEGRWRWLLIGLTLLAVISLALWPHATLLALVPVAVLLWWFLTRFRGFISLSSIEELIDSLLAVKLPDAPQPVTFAALHRKHGAELVIIAADLESGKLVRFDRTLTPDVPVARAVTASAAIPLVFLPVEVEGKACCDGGIVSNLPAWVFDAPLSAEPSALIITSENGAALPASPARRPRGGLHLAVQVLRAALFGARVLETRGLRNHLALPVSHDTIGTMDFGRTARHLPLLRTLDPAIRGSIEKRLLEMKHAQARFELYVASLTRDLGAEVAESLLCIVMMKDDVAAGYMPWYFSGRRDCRLEPYGDLIRRAVTSGAVVGEVGVGPADSDWCVVLPGQGMLTVAIACLGSGSTEHLEAITRSLERAELGARMSHHIY